MNIIVRMTTKYLFNLEASYIILTSFLKITPE